MSGRQRHGTRAARSGQGLVVRIGGLGAVLMGIVGLLLSSALAVSAAADQPAGSGAVMGGPAAATASPSSDGPVTEPRDATAQPAATASASTTGSPSTGGKNLAKTGSPSGSVLLGSLLALGVGVAFLVLGRGLPVGRHQRGGRPLHSAVS